MNTEIVSPKTLELINKYKNLSVGNVSCSVPYFNNKTTGRRAGLKAEIGKGNPDEILEEVKILFARQKINTNNLTPETLKKFLVDNDIGIDCSGFAYYVLNEEGRSRGRQNIKEYLKLPLYKGFVAKIFGKMRIVENAGVKTFAHNENSKVISLKDIKVGDMITLIGNDNGVMRDHILIIYKIDYQNSQTKNAPKNIYYIHSVAWPTDGEYSHGIHEGKIEIVDLNKNITEQNWIELEKTGEDNYTHQRAKKSITEIRRLNWF